MSGSVNRVTLLGRLGADPEVSRHGDRVRVTWSMATSRSWVTMNGEREARTEWHRCVQWGPAAEAIGRWAHKGRELYVEGALEYYVDESTDPPRKLVTIVVQRSVLVGPKPNKSHDERAREALKEFQDAEDARDSRSAGRSRPDRSRR